MIIALGVIHFIITMLLIILIMLQKSSNSGLRGITGSSSNPKAALGGRGDLSFIEKATIILAILFVVNNLLIAIIRSRDGVGSIIQKKIRSNEQVNVEKEELPLPIE